MTHYSSFKYFSDQNAYSAQCNQYRIDEMRRQALSNIKRENDKIEASTNYGSVKKSAETIPVQEIPFKKYSYRYQSTSDYNKKRKEQLEKQKKSVDEIRDDNYCCFCCVGFLRLIKWSDYDIHEKLEKFKSKKKK
jgi:hypothetical protein